MRITIRKIKPYFCAGCGEGLRGCEIPKEQQKAYGATHFMREIGIYAMDVDHVVYWRCPDCDYEWPR